MRLQPRCTVASTVDSWHKYGAEPCILPLEKDAWSSIPLLDRMSEVLPNLCYCSPFLEACCSFHTQRRHTLLIQSQAVSLWTLSYKYTDMVAVANWWWSGSQITFTAQYTQSWNYKKVKHNNSCRYVARSRKFEPAMSPLNHCIQNYLMEK